VGGVIGGVALLAIIVLAIFFIRKKGKTATTNNGGTLPTYIPPQDSSGLATGGGKLAPTAQGTPFAGQFFPASNQDQYPPQMQGQQQQFPNMAEAPGSYSQLPQQQNLNAAYPQNQSPNHTHYSISSANQLSPNSQSHLSAAFSDRVDTTSPVSTHPVSELGTSGGVQAPHIPPPTYITAAPGPAAGAPGGVEGRAEMSANMGGMSFPTNAYEIPGSDLHRY
jgi:hypothetical protein